MLTGTVGEFASLTAEAKSVLKRCLGMGSFRAFAFTRLCSTTLGHISRIGKLGPVAGVFVAGYLSDFVQVERNDLQK